jgi:endoglucanase
MTTWGEEGDYNDMIANFESIKKFFLDKGIPVVINEIGVLTEQQKEKKSIREFLYSHFSMVSDYRGIMACIWDTSKKTAGNMNFYNRETNKWYDPKIRKNLFDIKKGNMSSQHNII